jgi:hypothetical protein
MNEKNHAYMWFIHLEAVRCFQTEDGPGEEELRHLRQQLCLPEDEDMKDQPVVLVVHFVDHYFVVVADYEGDVMYVFGRHVGQDLAGVYVQDDEDWRLWKGNFLWIHLPKLFRWEQTTKEPGVVLSLSWKQVSNCQSFISWWVLIGNRTALIVAPLCAR